MWTSRAFVFGVTALAVLQGAVTSSPALTEEELNQDSDRIEGCYTPDYQSIAAVLGKSYADKQVQKHRLKKPKFETEELLKHHGNLWRHQKENGLFVIPYVFLGPTQGTNFMAHEKSQIIAAAFDLASDSGVIAFREKKPGDEFWVTFKNDEEGCFATLGKKWWSPRTGQPINLASGCFNKGIIQHEILHALGFFHEQSRPGRDAFVDVLEENIKETKESNFEEADAAIVDAMGTGYDYGSVMHYGAYAFSKNDKPTILSHGHEIGQRKGASETDLIQVRLLYQCDSGIRDLNAYLANRCTSDCKCSVGTVGCNSDDACHGDDTVCHKNTCIQELPCNIANTKFADRGKGWCRSTKGSWKFQLTNEQCKRACDLDRGCKAWSRSKKDGCVLYGLAATHSSGKGLDADHKCYLKGNLGYIEPSFEVGAGWCRPLGSGLGKRYQKVNPSCKQCQDACKGDNKCKSFSRGWGHCSLYPNKASWSGGVPPWSKQRCYYEKW